LKLTQVTQPNSQSKIEIEKEVTNRT